MYQTLLKPFLIDVKTLVLDTLFPITCLVCEKEGAFICEACQALLRPLDGQRCIVCQKPTPFGYTHPACHSPRAADGLISFYNYRDPHMANIIIKGKYSFVPDVYKLLGAMVAEKIKADYPNLLTDAHCLVPVPLHSWRQRWRGFNQAEVLCQALGVALHLPCANVLVRCRSTKTQKDLKKGQRKENVASAFALSPLFDKEVARENSFILVDDVTTTGATLLEAAKVLKRNGADKVICLTVARD